MAEFDVFVRVRLRGLLLGWEDVHLGTVEANSLDEALQLAFIDDHVVANTDGEGRARCVVSGVRV